ncbi:major centromere autoantigen B-like isoform X3 [Gouania willdenowi]|uniref:major centromere autoantigen B-like isoform X3 n=1 Tax=Gouania willdenowi TaxID=441366 RepID=UPI0010551CE3|nr:major centromere autoantigen B-like isoform X3 [Gouania willdenowi]
MDANLSTSWMMTAVKKEEEEEEEEEVLWREVKLSETDSEDEDEDEDEGCRRKAVPEELRYHDHLWDRKNLEKIPKEETEEFPSNTADQGPVKEEVSGHR